MDTGVILEEGRNAAIFEESFEEKKAQLLQKQMQLKKLCEELQFFKEEFKLEEMRVPNTELGEITEENIQSKIETVSRKLLKSIPIYQSLGKDYKSQKYKEAEKKAMEQGCNIIAFAAEKRYMQFMEPPYFSDIVVVLDITDANYYNQRTVALKKIQYSCDYHYVLFKR